MLRKRRFPSDSDYASKAHSVASFSGFSGRFGFLQSSETSTTMYDFQTGEVKRLAYGEWFDDDGHSVALGPGGELALRLHVEMRFTDVALLPQPMNFTTAVDVTPAPELSLEDMKWCGGRLVLVSAKRGYKLVLDIRDSQGALVASKEVPLPEDGELEDFVCNSRSAVLRYYVEPATEVDEGKQIAAVVELP